VTKKHPRPTARYTKAPSDTPPQPPEDESNLVRYARSELERAGLFKEDSDYGGMLGKAVLDLVEMFAREDHSGMSAGMAIATFARLANFQPLAPLTGAEDEWSNTEDDFAEGNGQIVWQNKRCFSVFRHTNRAGVVLEVYDIQAECLVDKMDDCFVQTIRTPITFPYSPPDRMKRILRRKTLWQRFTSLFSQD